MIPLWLILLALILSPVSQPLMAPLSTLIETKSPAGEDKEESEEKSEEKLAARSVSIRSFIDPEKLNLSRISKKAPSVSKDRLRIGYFPPIIGHQLVNGLRAPLLI